MSTPGVSEKDVSIEQDGTLSMSGERQAEHESSERGWYRIESANGDALTVEGTAQDA